MLKESLIHHQARGNTIGTVRLYEARGNSFSWGSWIIADGQTASAAMESALMAYAHPFDCQRNHLLSIKF